MDFMKVCEQSDSISIAKYALTLSYLLITFFPTLGKLLLLYWKKITPAFPVLLPWLLLIFFFPLDIYVVAAVLEGPHQNG